MRNLHLESLQGIVTIAKQDLALLRIELAQYNHKLRAEALSQNDRARLYNSITQIEFKINQQQSILNRHIRELNSLANSLGLTE